LRSQKREEIQGGGRCGPLPLRTAEKIAGGSTIFLSELERGTSRSVQTVLLPRAGLFLRAAFRHRYRHRTIRANNFLWGSSEERFAPIERLYWVCRKTGIKRYCLILKSILSANQTFPMGGMDSELGKIDSLCFENLQLKIRRVFHCLGKIL
jgi:hypothetical protein